MKRLRKKNKENSNSCVTEVAEDEFEVSPEDADLELKVYFLL